MKKRIRKHWFFCGFAALIVLLIAWTIWGNTALELNKFTVESAKIPTAFDGYIIAHISDLHNAEIGEGNETLIRMLSDAKPDMIAITGDLIDSRNTNVDISLNFIRKAVEIAPCYYVTGNHESRVDDDYSRLEDGLIETGVTVLRDEKLLIERNGEAIAVVGIDDPTIRTTDFEEVLNALTEREENYTVLLSHRPELFDMYSECGVDLVLSGHAHGGQFRFPFIGGAYAPGQGLFPKYDSGLYTEEGTSMIVSRGIGNSIIPIRFNNRPEVITIELKSEDTSSK